MDSVISKACKSFINNLGSNVRAKSLACDDMIQLFNRALDLVLTGLPVEVEEPPPRLSAYKILRPFPKSPELVLLLRLESRNEEEGREEMHTFQVFSGDRLLPGNHVRPRRQF